MSGKFNFLHMVWIIFMVIGLTIGCGGGGGDADGGGGDTTAGGSTETGNPMTLAGVTEKGPFYKGADVLIRELDADTLVPTQITHTTTIDNNLGGFSYTAESGFTSSYVDISVTGSYFNEISGEQSGSGITLSAFVDVRTTREINVNILTTIALKRVKYLMVHEDLSYEAAKIQARFEILTLFNLPQEDIDEIAAGGNDSFIHMSIAREGVENAVLLSLSVILSSHPTDSIEDVMDRIASDIETDGRLDDDNTQYLADLIANAADLVLDQIRTHLVDYYANLAAIFLNPDFEYYFDLFVQPYIRAAMPTFSLPSGTYTEATALELSTITTDAEIYYKVNGGEPQLYTGPIEISAAQPVAAITAWTVRADIENSFEASSYYFYDSDFVAGAHDLNMDIAAYRADMAGEWVGFALPPVDYLSPDNVHITIGTELQYTAECLSRYYYDATNPIYQLYNSWVRSMQYYAVESLVGSKFIDLQLSLDEDGMATADIVVQMPGGVTMIGATLDRIAMSADRNHMQFRLSSAGLLGPITFQLTRLEE